MAQWHWIDERGVKVFSDLPPPPSIPEKNILRKPPEFTDNSAPGTLMPVAPLSPNPTANAAQLSKTVNGSASLKAAEDARLAELKAFEEKNNKIKADNCVKAKQSMAVIASGTRIQSADAKGEIVVLGDKERSEETNKLQSMIAGNC